MTQTTFQPLDSGAIDWDKVGGLVPAIVQHYLTGEVLMLGYMSPEALSKTQSSHQVTFYSRTKDRLWTKGETSGNTLELKAIGLDCDRDTLLVLAKPSGPTCHLNTTSCFDQTASKTPMLNALAKIIEKRSQTGEGQSYTQQLLASGVARCAQKVGEEGVEVALAATSGDTDALHNEAADLLYHLLVTLKAAGGDFNTVLETLHQRQKGE
jgi:phosphoribosyl-ATP pyrophosphohydrolase/phosphoribosyl-AMP cyclohydrolase